MRPSLGSLDRTRSAYVALGGLCGLTWTAGFRGWMAQLARGSEAESVVTWLTMVLVLLPGLVIGALLGESWYRRRTGVPSSRWLVFSPVLFASALLDPAIFRGLITDGTGGGALIVVATALCGGFALSGRGWTVGRVASAVVALLGLLMVAGMGGIAAPMSTPRGAWVSLFGFVFVLLFCLAACLPHRPVRPSRGVASFVVLGALCGVAWSCALRSFMAEVAGADSAVHWANTFGFILLTGAVVGALLGWAEFLRRHGGRPGWRRLALAPLLFGAVLVSNPLHLPAIFDNGIGAGAIALPILAMLGGYAVSPRGPLWSRCVAGAVFVAGLLAWLLTATDVGGQSFALDTSHGLWVSTLYESLVVVLALSASIPHQTPLAPDGPRTPVPANTRARPRVTGNRVPST